jgi:hypothetical protein
MGGERLTEEFFQALEFSDDQGSMRPWTSDDTIVSQVISPLRHDELTKRD